MNALICAFCRAIILESNKKAMVYDISIMAAENYTAKSAQEQSLTFAADHVCYGCTSEIVATIKNLKRDLSKLRDMTPIRRLRDTAPAAKGRRQ